MKNAGVQYVLILLALVTAGRCLKHLFRLDGWTAMGFVLFKDLILSILVVYLFRLSRSLYSEGKLENRNLAVPAMGGLLVVSIASDSAITFLH